MHIAEQPIPGGRIYAAATPARGSRGFHAAVVVMAGTVPGQRRELFRDEQLLGGRVWMDPDGAVEFALEAGEAAVLAQRAVPARG